MNTQQQAPIGMFDSGLGGLSIWKEVSKWLPNESILYVADSGNCPYGAKPKSTIRALSERIVLQLLEQGCKMIVVACNTATAAAIQYLREKYSIPFIGIEPAIKPAAQRTKTGVVGILATKGTLEGDLFHQTKTRYASDVDVVVQVGTGLVEIVEKNLLDAPSSYRLVQQYIQPMINARADQIVLGCTHYPFLMPLIERVVEGRAKIINPAIAIAKQVRRVLQKKNLLNTNISRPLYHFYTTGDEAILTSFVQQHTNIQFTSSPYWEKTI